MWPHIWCYDHSPPPTPPPGQNVFYLLLQLNVGLHSVKYVCVLTVSGQTAAFSCTQSWEEAEPTRMICHVTQSLEASRGLTFSTGVNVKSAVIMGFTVEEESCCVHEVVTWKIFVFNNLHVETFTCFLLKWSHDLLCDAIKKWVNHHDWHLSVAHCWLRQEH